MNANQATAPSEQILSWLEALLFFEEGQVELRAVGVDGKQKKERGGRFSRLYDRSNVRHLVKQAVDLSGRSEAVYFTLNPIALEVNRPGRDTDIIRRCLLLIDCDSARDETAKQLAGDGSKLSATDTEKAHGVKLAADVAAYLARLGWPAPVRGDSGNGAHLLFAIDLPNDETSRDLVKSVLMALAHRFDTADASIDTTVYNASRVTKLYGTLVCKGTATEDRPHRASSLLEIPEGFGRFMVSREMLEVVAALAPRSEPPAMIDSPATGRKQTRPANGREWSVEDRVIAYLAKCPGGVSGNKGHNATFKTAIKAGPGFNLTPDQAFRLLWTHWNVTCQPPWSEKDLRRKVDEAFKKEQRRGWLLNEQDSPTPLTPLTPKGSAGSGLSSGGAYGVNGVNGVPPGSERDPGDELPIRIRDWPIGPGDAAYHGLLGRIVRTVAPHTEADPSGLLFLFLTAIGNMIGRSAHLKVTSTSHFTNLFVVAVGRTSSGRKGTALDVVKQILRDCDESWSSHRWAAGLVSGEGLIWGVRDPIRRHEKIKQKGKPDEYKEVEIDPGVADKRLLVVESEFGGTLKVTAREGNTLSAVIRQAWDSGEIRSLAKNSPGQATNAHISLIGNITDTETIRHLSEIEATNGFANRILWVAVRRSQYLPDGSDIPADEVLALVHQLQMVRHWAAGQWFQLQRDEEARALWHSIYPDLTRDRTGLLGSILARAAPQVMRMACIYAVLDRSKEIKLAHLEAALDLWGYCERSAAYIFGHSLGDKDADHLMNALRAAPAGLTRTQIREDVYQKNRPAAEIARVLGRLLELRLVRSETTPTEGRPVERWFAADQNAEQARSGPMRTGDAYEGDLPADLPTVDISSSPLASPPAPTVTEPSTAPMRVRGRI